MANYPQELAQDVVCQSHTGHMTGLWFLPSPAFKAVYPMSFLSHALEPGYNDIGLYDTSSITSDMLCYQFIRHC